MLRDHASFQADYPSDGEPGRVAAEPVARAILDGLATAGYAIDRFDSLDYAYDFRVHAGDQRFFGMVGPSNDGVRQWLFLLESELPVWRRWFGASDAAAHEAVLRAAHRVIAALPGAQAIRWYTLAEWNEAPDDHWSSDPVA